jgi:hypothetical protein
MQAFRLFAWSNFSAAYLVPNHDRKLRHLKFTRAADSAIATNKLTFRAHLPGTATGTTRLLALLNFVRCTAASSSPDERVASSGNR